MSIVVLGTVALDTVKTPFGRREFILGGSASHFSMSARLFTHVDIVAVVGKDFPGKHIEFLRKKGINLDSLEVCGGDTFRWEGKYEGDLNTAHTLNTHLGVLATFRPQITEAQKKIKHLFLANVDPDIQGHLIESMRSPELIGMDSMNFWINTKRKSLLRTLRKVHIFVANDQEARSLTGETNLIKAARHLSSYGPKMIVIKKGEHGSMFFSKRFIFLLPAYPMEKVVDPTGAGDTFAGGFMGHLSTVRKINEKTIRRAVAYGTIAASFNVEGFGLDRTSRLTLKDIEKRLNFFKKHILL
ncbi:MAG: PfkB family carbohydrate kinase [Candidatus Omnitrophica bacterium]|nr:PfkB family carbohydrate kinase [Candidatus Omnitrophota bacterium]